VRIWDAVSGNAVGSLAGQAPHVTAVAYAPDGSRLATASGDGTVRIWDAVSGDPVATLLLQGPQVTSVAYAPDGTRLATASEDGTVQIWDAVSGSYLATFICHSGRVTAVAYSSDGSRLATASTDGTVRIWGAASGARMAIITAHTGTVTAVAFAPDGAALASASYDGTVRITRLTDEMVPTPTWRRGLGARRPSLSFPAGQALRTGLCGAATSLVYSPDGRVLATGHVTGCVALTHVGQDESVPATYLLGLRGADWVTFHGEHRYQLHGDPAGRFWWTAGLCRFEPGELDGYGVEHIAADGA